MPETLSRRSSRCCWRCCAALAAANEAAPEAADPALEARMTRIAAELRCLVCQNQTIADSNAELAQSTCAARSASSCAPARATSEIVDYMVARYGDFVLYRPPLKPTTALLWFGPAAAAARRHGAAAGAAPADRAGRRCLRARRGRRRSRRAQRPGRRRCRRRRPGRGDARP